MKLIVISSFMRNNNIYKWEGSRHVFDEERTCYTGNVLITLVINVLDVAEKTLVIMWHEDY